MGLFVTQKDSRSELQERIAADLRAKAQQTVGKGDDSGDDIADSKYMEGTKQTTALAWAWILIAVMAAVVVALFLMQGR
jgi:hypothetical protein